MYNKIEELCSKKKITISKLCKEIGVSSSTFTELKAGRTKELSAKNLLKVANYLEVPVGYLLGEGNIADSVANNDEALMFALYGNDNKDITPAMLEDIRKFAQFVRQRDQGKEDTI